jgi:hypothetical protein
VRSNTCRWLIGFLSLLTVFLAGFVPAQAGYAPPSHSGSLSSEISTFLNDFNQWNQSENNQPLQVLEMTPAQNRDQMALWLFWLWLHAPNGGPGSLSAPPTSLSFGTIPSGQIGEEPLVLPLSGGDDSPGLGENPGGGSLLGGPLPPGHNPNNGPGSVGPLLDDPPTAPEPSTLTLLSTGAIAVLTYCWNGRRARGQKPSEPAV